MSMRNSWLHFRTDLAGIACFVLATVCLATARWQPFATFALGAAVFCAICPRMKGPFGFFSGGTRFGGTLEGKPGLIRKKPRVILRGKVTELDRGSRTGDLPQPSSREPAED